MLRLYPDKSRFHSGLSYAREALRACRAGSSRRGRVQRGLSASGGADPRRRRERERGNRREPLFGVRPRRQQLVLVPRPSSCSRWCGGGAHGRTGAGAGAACRQEARRDGHGGPALGGPARPQRDRRADRGGLQVWLRGHVRDRRRHHRAAHPAAEEDRRTAASFFARASPRTAGRREARRRRAQLGRQERAGVREGLRAAARLHAGLDLQHHSRVCEGEGHARREMGARARQEGGGGQQKT